DPLENFAKQKPPRNKGATTQQSNKKARVRLNPRLLFYGLATGALRAFSDLIEADCGPKLLCGRTFLTAGCATLLESCSSGWRCPRSRAGLRRRKAGADGRFSAADPRSFRSTGRPSPRCGRGRTAR